MDKLEYYRYLINSESFDRVLRIGREFDQLKAGKCAGFGRTTRPLFIDSKGWQGEERIKENTIHVGLRDGKIWIEEDGTEDGVVTDFLHAAVPREDIVLAFHPPHLRQYTEFAIA